MNKTERGGGSGTFCSESHSQSTSDTAMRWSADLVLRWKSSSWPSDSAGRTSWEAALSCGSQMHRHSAASNLRRGAQREARVEEKRQKVKKGWG